VFALSEVHNSRVYLCPEPSFGDMISELGVVFIYIRVEKGKIVNWKYKPKRVASLRPIAICVLLACSGTCLLESHFWDVLT